MGEWSQVTEEARQLYDHQNYKAAHNLLWAAATEAAPDVGGVFYLKQSLERQQTQELIELARKYHGSLDVQRAVTEALAARNHWWSIETATELLRIGLLSEKEQLDMRWARLRATIQQRWGGHPRAYETLPEDFSALWNAADTKVGLFVPCTQKVLLATIAQIHHSPKAIPVLQKLYEIPALPEPVRNFIKLKVSELMALEVAWQAIESSPTDASS
ncbi:MAG: hypothetical protein M3441_09055 [Chloroflexota bacterium]|nr:hypothetical protein [Chloroflexota bacterium]